MLHFFFFCLSFCWWQKRTSFSACNFCFPSQTTCKYPREQFFWSFNFCTCICTHKLWKDNMVVYHLAKSFVNSGKCSKFSERLERYSKVSNLNFPTENVFSPVPSPTPNLICVTCYVIGVVQMVHANPDRNLSLGIFAHYLCKPSTNRFSHVNSK